MVNLHFSKVNTVINHLHKSDVKYSKAQMQKSNLKSCSVVVVALLPGPSFVSCLRLFMLAEALMLL